MLGHEVVLEFVEYLNGPLELEFLKFEHLREVMLLNLGHLIHLVDILGTHCSQFFVFLSTSISQQWYIYVSYDLFDDIFRIRIP
ncbi:hypothetical protein BpHYR1_042179 [Brachionus plicatilis]|uniref:Uncharacterized protein n=1 Tax=Brachionus plicatilis TaxID=10195 RepID=A0A3M7SFP7_BRAPC|nr:hypothetical protein BpHYR1_042179 [Brachionus plicatilis]